jgi:hypothetical protein
VTVPAALVESFVSSRMGLGLCDPFPVGTLHRASFPQIEAWQKKYAPTVKRRTPKHRTRKRG